MPGYRLRLVKEEINPRYICDHCHLLLKDAVLTACGHFYCESCVDQSLSRNIEEFPICEKDGIANKRESIIPDNNTRAEILAFPAFCDFYNEGCLWIGEIRHHERHSAMCGFYEVPCENSRCHEFVKRSDLTKHMIQHCKYRLVDCAFCNWKGPHSFMKTHIEHEHCPAPFQDNPEREQQIGENNIQNEHQQGNPRNEPSNTQSANVLQEKVRRLENEVRRLEDQVRQLQDQVNLSENGQDELRDQVNHLKNRQVELLRSSDEQNLVLSLERNERENALLSMQRRLESADQVLAPRNDLDEFTSFDGQLVWKIAEFARRRNDAVSRQQSFYSPCFYTSRFGYKMCARMYLNGDGMGRGTHISVFIVIMRGEYDALLHWPFRQKVTFMLLDQDNVEHVVDTFRPDPSSSSFQRPRRETNIASGCPMFCSLTELNNHAYVRDDTMFLRIIVDTSDL